MKTFLFGLLLMFALTVDAQIAKFRFAFISDTHIGSPDGKAEEDLRRTVADINSRGDIDFVVLTGDITELGTDEELARAKKILSELKVPWYIIPGNHDTGWSESGGMGFTNTFGYDRFVFDHNGIRFIGCASGPYVRMSDGHVPRDAINWLQNVLDTTSTDQPIIFLNHYPLDNGLDNWYEVIDLLKTRNTIGVLCGHGHANKSFNFEDIPGVMGRSNLRAKKLSGGYNLVDIRTDSILFSEKDPIAQIIKPWTGIKIEKHDYAGAKKFPRPLFNNDNSLVNSTWTFSGNANIISTPAIENNLVVFGDQEGKVLAVSIKNGREKWRFKTGGAIYSSPAVSNGLIVFGSADGAIYCLDNKGRQVWKTKTGAAVLGSPAIAGDTVYIGGSDHCFRALHVKDGKEIWKFQELSGPVVSTPVIYKSNVIFGAWDTWLYCLDQTTGKLNWKWNNGSSIRNYSPASCVPVVKDDVIYIVAPDRYFTAVDAITGLTLWRTNESAVRESIGMSNNGKYVYGKTMNDTLTIYQTGRSKNLLERIPVGYGYDHVPSMPVEIMNSVVFGTRNGVVYAVDMVSKKVAWWYKIDNSMVNTIRSAGKYGIIASTMDGKVVLLRQR